MILAYIFKCPWETRSDFEYPEYITFLQHFLFFITVSINTIWKSECESSCSSDLLLKINVPEFLTELVWYRFRNRKLPLCRINIIHLGSGGKFGMVSKVMFSQSCCLGFSSKLHPDFHEKQQYKNCQAISPKPLMLVLEGCCGTGGLMCSFVRAPQLKCFLDSL